MGMIPVYALTDNSLECPAKLIKVTSAARSGKADVISPLLILESNNQPNALNSTLYALEFNEDVGCGRALGSIAGVAVPARWPHASLAQHLCMVRPCPAALG